MLSDFHIHSCFSSDSSERPESIIETAIQKGMKQICITDHQDFDYPKQDFTLDTKSYLNTYCSLQEAYKEKIDIRIGVELGLELRTKSQIMDFVSKNSFDFIIGSSHLVNGEDPYYPEYYENRSIEEAYSKYFESILENIPAFSFFNVYGHLDYICRYAPANTYSYAKYQPIIDEILRQIIAAGKGIEVNTSNNPKTGFFTNPHIEIIKRYRELGGEIVTVGSDAHKCGRIGNQFEKLPELLKECGFRYYTIFFKQQPEFLPLP